MPSLRMTNIGGVRRISIVAGARALRNGTFAAYSKTPPDGGGLQILSKKYYFFDKDNPAGQACGVASL